MENTKSPVKTGMKYNVTFNIPGGWLGNDATPEHKQGNIIVDPEKILSALHWLERRAFIVSTAIYHTPTPGIVINYEVK